MARVHKASLSACVAIAGLTVVMRVGATEIRYLGKDGETNMAVVYEQSRGVFEVKAGDDLPGLGKVVEFDDDQLICRYRLSPTEKEDLRRRKAAVYDVRQVVTSRVGARIVVVPVR